MKTAFQAAVLCVALASSLARARAATPVDLGVILKLKSPIWSDAATPREQLADGSRVPLEVGIGLLGGVLLAIPGSLIGYMITDQRVLPSISCDQSGCVIGGAANGYVVMMVGGYVGFCVGTGLGVSLAGYAGGGPFSVSPAILGAVLGGLTGFFVTLSATLLLGIAGVPAFRIMTPVVLATTIAGTIIGSIWTYEANSSSAPLKAVPMLAPVPGGAVLGVSVAM
ncbi:MAG TPA: hypothetical protein VND93_17205 [Myxococcales bacterium]|nr:hypothetical protein [Myxococcales bacterium]